MVEDYNKRLATLKEYLEKTQQTTQEQILGFKNETYLADLADLRRKLTDYTEWEDESLRQARDIDNRIVMLNTRIAKRHEEQGDLKSKLTDYKSCFGKIDCDKLANLFDLDKKRHDDAIESIQKNLDQSKAVVEDFINK